MSIDINNEQRLLQLIRQEDPMAMKMLYSTYVRYLTAICSRYIINDEDVKDVLQDSFLKIFSGISAFEYRGKGSLKGWITKIVMNETLKFLQRNSRFELIEYSDTEFDLIDEEPDIDVIPTALLFNIIRELPDGYRTIFNLYIIEDKSHKEIAKLLNIKESTSASQLHRAKSLLAAKIKQYNS